MSCSHQGQRNALYPSGLTERVVADSEVGLPNDVDHSASSISILASATCDGFSSVAVPPPRLFVA